MVLQKNPNELVGQPVFIHLRLRKYLTLNLKGLCCSWPDFLGMCLHKMQMIPRLNDEAIAKQLQLDEDAECIGIFIR